MEKKFTELTDKFFKHMTIVVIATAIILLIPFVGMQFSSEVNWSLGDFIVAAILLISTGFAYELITLKSRSVEYKIAAGMLVVAVLFLIWVNLAVGIIGSENNPANMMYGAVLVIAFLGTIISRLQPKNMAITLFIMATVQMLIPLIALLIWNPQSDSMSSIIDILRVFGINVFIAVLFIGSGLLFKNSAIDSNQVS